MIRALAQAFLFFIYGRVDRNHQGIIGWAGWRCVCIGGGGQPFVGHLNVLIFHELV